ncbi:hypothetical protein [Rubrobacter marinus]|nr:hypothetical protein [Rubrobacter marinus]
MSSIGAGVRPRQAPGRGGAELVDYYDCMPGKGLPASAFGAGAARRP